MQRKMQLTANEISAILQNISQQKMLSGEKITNKDLEYSARTANLSVYPGITQYSTQNNCDAMPLEWLPLIHLFYLVGKGNGKAEIKWIRRMHPSPISYHFNSTSNRDEHYDTVITQKVGETINTSTFYPKFEIMEGEAKVIVQYSIYHGKGISPRKLFGFLFYTPRHTTARGDSRSFTYFTSFSVFTPIGTGFSEKAPN